MTRRLSVIVAAALLVVFAATAANAAPRVVEPRADPVAVHLDTSGNPQSFTIKVTGFAPDTRVYVEQCDGTAPTDPKWRPSVDCDLGTQTAGLLADNNGTVAFPAGDRNFGFKPVRGKSPEGLFNCLAPGDGDPKNGLASSSACYVLVTANYTTATPNQAAFRMTFDAKPSSSSSKHNDTLLAVVVLAAIGFAAVGFGIALSGRRRRARA